MSPRLGTHGTSNPGVARTCNVADACYSPGMSEFTARNIGVLLGTALLSFGLLYWALDVDIAAAFGVTAIYIVLALVIMYFKGRTST